MHERVGITDSQSGSCALLAVRLHIPIEIWENIFDMLYLTNSYRDIWNDIVTLRDCSLVCRAWCCRAQKNLFSRLWISDSTSLDQLSTTLDGTQHLRGYVYEVILIGYQLHTTASIFPKFAPIFAPKLPNLKSIRVVDFHTSQTWLRIKPDPPKTKCLTYIPVHPRFPASLSSFKAVSYLELYHTTFHSFREFAQMLHGLRDLKKLACCSIGWMNPSDYHTTGADIMDPPQLAVERPILPPFSSKIRELRVRFYTVITP